MKYNDPLEQPPRVLILRGECYHEDSYELCDCVTYLLQCMAVVETIVQLPRGCSVLLRPAEVISGTQRSFQEQE